MNIVTETIAGVKGTTVNSDKGQREMVIVTTNTAKVIWVSKSAFDFSAENISFKEMKKGEKYIKKGVNGAEDQELQLKEDRNEFVGCGKNTKAANAVLVFQELFKIGITPAIAL